MCLMTGIGDVRTHIQTTHESNLAIDKTELLMVGPVQHHIVAGAIQGRKSVFGDLG